MIFTMSVCYLKVGTKPIFFSKIPSLTDYRYMNVSYMIHLALVEFLILQFTSIPLVYLQIEKNDNFTCYCAQSELWTISKFDW